MENLEKNWYVLRTQSRCEQSAAKALQRFHLETYLPLFWSERQWSDRKKRLQMVLFPGYLFLYGEEKDLRHTYAMPSLVTGFLKLDKKPVTVSEQEIERIRQICTYANVVIESIATPIQVGDEVEVVEGNLKGNRGFVCGERGDKLRLHIPALNFFAYISLPVEHLRKLTHE